MRVVYVLNGVALYGGVKVVLQHAQALRRSGIEAVVVSPEPAPAWFRGAAEFCSELPLTATASLSGFDVAVGTIYFTLPAAMRIPGARVFHLCQCYEGLYEGARTLWPEIDAVYRLPTRKLVVSPHLAELIASRFGQESAWIPQPFDAQRFSPPPERSRQRGERFRLLVAGGWDVPIKGIEWGLRALRPLAEEGWLELVRLSLEADEEERRLWPEAERWLHVPPDDVPDIIRGVDAYAGFSSEVEGFGLPALEAMGCGRPVVATDIAASRALDPGARASLRVAAGDAEGLRAAVRRLHEEPGLGERLGAAGRAIAEEFSEERTARALRAAFDSDPS